MKTKMKTPKVENSKTLEAMKLYLTSCALMGIPKDDLKVLYKHIRWAEKHPEVLARVDARVEKGKKEKGNNYDNNRSIF